MNRGIKSRRKDKQFTVSTRFLHSKNIQKSGRHAIGIEFFHLFFLFPSLACRKVEDVKLISAISSIIFEISSILFNQKALTTSRDSVKDRAVTYDEKVENPITFFRRHSDDYHERQDMKALITFSEMMR